jgi:hypothetical protein
LTRPKLGIVLVLLHTLFACTALSAQDDVAAVIIAPDQASRAELLQVVRQALGGAPVALADDALTRDDWFTVERARIVDSEGRRLDGRVLDPPERFRLVLSGSQCVLIREADQARFALTAARCRPKR